MQAPQKQDEHQDAASSFAQFRGVQGLPYLTYTPQQLLPQQVKWTHATHVPWYRVGLQLHFIRAA